MPKFTFPVSRIALVPGLELLAQDMVDTAGDDQQPDDLVEYFGEWHMENCSEAGYSECDPTDRRSERAFARVLRYKKDDLKRLCDAVGYDRGGSEYREFGFASAVTQVLSVTPEYALALEEARHGVLGAEGPFGRSGTLFLRPSLWSLGYDHQTEVGDLPDTRKEFEEIFLRHLVNEYHSLQAIEDAQHKSMVAFASAVRVGDIDNLVRRLQRRGLKSHAGLTVAVAHTIIGALRVNRVFAYGVKSAQFDAEKAKVKTAAPAPAVEAPTSSDQNS